MSGLRLAPLAAVWCFLVPAAYTQQAVPIASASAARAVLDKYCVTCHNQRTKTAGLALDALDLSHVSRNAESWEKVVRKIRTGAMPPAMLPRPDKAAADGVVTWLETELDRAAVEHPEPGSTHAASSQPLRIPQCHPRLAGARNRRGFAAARRQCGLRI